MLNSQFFLQDDHGQQQNVMPAEWVRNKHLGKKGEFRYF